MSTKACKTPLQTCQPRHAGRVGARSVDALVQLAATRCSETGEAKSEEDERRGLGNRGDIIEAVVGRAKASADVEE